MAKDTHIQVVGWLFVAHGVLLLLGAAGTLICFVASGLFSGNVVHTLVSPIVGIVVMAVMAVFALPSLLTGRGLLEGKSWARVVAMILAVFAFFNFPLGTALCIYTFWVLWGRDADSYFEGAYPSYHERHQFR